MLSTSVLCICLHWKILLTIKDAHILKSYASNIFPLGFQDRAVTTAHLPWWLLYFSHELLENFARSMSLATRELLIH